MKTVSSRRNPIVRAFRALADTPDAGGTRVLLDGLHLVREARAAALEFEAITVASSHLNGDTEEGRMARALDSAGAPVFTVSEAAFAAVSPVRSAFGHRSHCVAKALRSHRHLPRDQRVHTRCD